MTLGNLTGMQPRSKRSVQVAVILCGSGYKDGSEIRESVGVLWALSAVGATVQCFAPDEDQYDVVNCLTGEVDLGAKRNMRVEAARIARGQVRSLSEARANEFDAVILPGGFGAAKNLCTFAQQGAKGAVRTDLQALLSDFHQQKKPIGAVCIAPALVALAFPGQGFRLTLGEEGEAAAAIQELGHRHQVCSSFDCVVDAQNRVVSTPAYMDDEARLHEIFQGIEKLVHAVVEMSER